MAILLPENTPIEEVREFFKKDNFAYQAAGCRIVEARKGYAVCEMDITDLHRNAMGGVMGGAIFTLADYALAVSSNLGEEPSVAASNSIEFMNGAKGNKLIATSTVDKSGRHLGFYTIEVTDDTGRKVAKMTATCYR